MATSSARSPLDPVLETLIGAEAAICKIQGSTGQSSTERSSSAAIEPVRRVAPVPRQECQPTTVASVTALPRVQAAIARLHPPVVPEVSEPDVRRRISCKRKAPLPVPVLAPLRRRIVGKQSLEVTRQAEPWRKNRQTSSLFTVPRAVISQLARQRRVHSAAIQEALHESASSISDSTLQHISSVRTARAKRTFDRRGERKRAYRSFYPSGVWNSTIGRQTLRQTLLDHPIPVEKFQRQCHGKCVPCSRCYRCREYGCCFGGRYQNWGCDKCSKFILCRTSLNDEEYTLASIRLARRGTIPPTISGLQRPPRPDGADPCKCIFCVEHAANQTMMAKHERCCLHMPFDMWIARTRLVLESQPDRTIPCTHCGTLFQSKGGAVKHEKKMCTPSSDI